MAGNDWFPLHFDRLRKSRWWRRASDTARARNVMLWGEAYKQVPAGSMPDDDDELAEAAGYGMDVDAFLAVKAEIMSPWTLCSDGRWYHPTVCEVVLDAWARAGERRKKDAVRKAEQRARARGQAPASSGVTPQSVAVPRDTPPVTPDTSENQRDQGTQDKTGQDRTPQPPRGMSEDGFARLWQAYPEHGRKTCAKALARQCADNAVDAGDAEETIIAGARALASSGYIAGGGKPRRIDRWLTERLYANDAAEVTAGKPTHPWPGPPNIRAAVLEAMGEKWVRTWLDPCEWDAEAAAILAPRDLTVTYLERHVRSQLVDCKVAQVRVQGRAA